MPNDLKGFSEVTRFSLYYRKFSKDISVVNNNCFQSNIPTVC